MILGVLLSHQAAVAQSDIHRPIGTGDCAAHVGADYNDSSAGVWIASAQKWIMTDQRYFYVFSRDGVLERQSSAYVRCKGAAEHEGLTLVDSPRCSNDVSRRCYSAADCVAPGTCSVAGAHGDVLWVQEEDLGSRCTNQPNTTCADDAACGGSAGQTNLCKGAGAMCRYSIAAILNMGQNGNPATPAPVEEVWVTGVPRNSSEGLVFVPDAASGGRYGGYFFWAEQANARWRRFTLDAAQSAIAWGGYQSFPAGCALGGDLSDGYYDFVRQHFYSQTDGGNRFTVHSADFSTCYASVQDPVTCRADNGYEGLAFGGGGFAYLDDFTGHPDDTFNGLWLFEDDFCGDGVRVSTETCDAGDIRGQTCATAAAADCAAGHCGPTWSGPLACRGDCTKFDDALCVEAGPVENTATSTSAAANTSTVTVTRTPSYTATATHSPSRTATATATPTATSTPSPTPTPTIFLAGAVLYYGTGVPVANVVVEAAIADGEPSLMTVVSDSSGTFTMGGVPPNTGVLRPQLTDSRPNILRGLSSLDASWIQEHRVGSRSFTANQVLAADTTGNGAISSLDVTRLQEYRVGAISRLPVSTNCDSDWAFVPVPGPQGNPTPIAPRPAPTPCVPGAIAYASLGSGASGQDFQAILFGDVTGNWSPLPTPVPGGGSAATEGIEWGGADADVAGPAEVVLRAEPPACAGPCVVMVPGSGGHSIVAANHLRGVQAIDLTVEVPSGSEVTGVQKAQLAVAAGDCSLVWAAQNGQVKVSLACVTAMSGGGALLSVEIQGGAGASLSTCVLDEAEVPCDAVP